MIAMTSLNVFSFFFFWQKFFFSVGRSFQLKSLPFSFFFSNISWDTWLYIVLVTWIKSYKMEVKELESLIVRFLSIWNLQIVIPGCFFNMIILWPFRTDFHFYFSGPSSFSPLKKVEYFNYCLILMKFET